MPSNVGEFVVADTVDDSLSTTALSGIGEITNFEINGQTFLFAASYYDGVQVLSIDADGDMELVDAAINNGSTLLLYGARDVVVYEQGGTVYLTICSAYYDTLTTFSVGSAGDSNDGHLIHQSTVTHPGLDGPYRIEHVEIDGRDFILSTSRTSDALHVYQATGAGDLLLTDTVFDSDDEDYQIDRAYALEIVTVGARTFVYVGSDSSSEGFSAFELSALGTLTPVQDVPLTNVYTSDFESVTIGGSTYLFVTDMNNEEIATYQVNSDGTVALLSTIDLHNIDGGNYGGNPEGLTVMEIDGVLFLATSVDVDGIVLFAISDDGSLSPAQSYYSGTFLDDSDFTTHVVVNGRHYIVSSNYHDNALTSLEIGGGDNTVLGTGENDTLHGLGNDDELIGYAGNDRMFGGSGDDVLVGGSGHDHIYGGDGFDVIVGQSGGDWIEGGGGADVLVGGAGIDRISYESSGAGVTVNLTTDSATGGHATGDIIVGFEQVRGSALNDVITGNNGANSLDGLGGNDRIFGEGGNDVITGGGGRDEIAGGIGSDRIYGQFGSDTVYAGSGADRVWGGEGHDTLNGGGGHDRLFGEGGNDILSGGDGDDILNGGGGRDVLSGGRGSDTLTGGGNHDVFVFGNNFGSDTITDFGNGSDRIDFSGHSGFNSFSDVTSAAVQFSGNLVIIDGSHSLVLESVTLADLSVSDFIFVS